MGARQPSRGDVWVYIDRLDKRSRAVWAVHDLGPTGKSRYRVAMAVHIYSPAYSVYQPGPTQPRAWLRTRGQVRWLPGRVAEIY